MSEVSDNEEEDTGMEHKRPLIALIVTSTVSLLLTLLINGISSDQVIPQLFDTNIGGMSDKLYLNITPASWTFSIWFFIYAAQFLFCVYTLTLLCRRGPDKALLYLSPPYMIPHVVYICYIVANVCNMMWVVLWVLERIVASGVIIAIMALFLILATAFSVYGLYVSLPELEELNMKAEIWVNRILVHNSLAFYATWVCIATLLNFAGILCYVMGVPQEDASTVSLGVLALDLLVYFVLDLFLAYRYCNYIVIPYVVVIVALSGSLDKNFIPWTRNSVFTVILLIVAVGLFIVKIVIMVWRHYRSGKLEEKEQMLAESDKKS